MYYVMAKAQHSYQLSERLIRAISQWQVLTSNEDDVEDLLEEGADVNQGHGMLLPLHVASMVGDIDVVHSLLDRGAQINVLDGYGRAALHYAAEKDVFCLKLLLEVGANVNIRDTNQDTPLHWAAFKNNKACVKELLEKGADVNATDYNKDTPLSWASLKGNLDCIRILLDYNAEVSCVNYDNKTPIIRCSQIVAAGINTDSDDKSLELLIQANGEFDLRDSEAVMPSWVQGDNKLTEMFRPLCCNTRSLQELCRYSVRQSLGPQYLPKAIPKLPIPSRVRQYLLLQSQ